MSKDPRQSRGRQKPQASFPVAGNKLNLPMDYQSTLADLKQRIASERLRITLSANAAMILLYWDIGQTILTRQKQKGWGAKIIDMLSEDLKEAFPEMNGFSPRNLKYMRRFAEQWPDREIVQRNAAQIPWRSNQLLLDKLNHQETRCWYAQKTAENGWSRDILALQIESRLHERQGKALNNFALTLPPSDSDMAAQVFKDPYLFDFLGTADTRKEREVEQALVDHVQKFLLELGAGFAFVGRQVLLEVGDRDFRLDLLFYHLKLRCYVVIELKAVPFDPGFTGTLNLYLSAVDDLLRHPDDKPTIGLLLCKSKNDLVVEYALDGYRRPMGVAQWEGQLTKSLPDDLKGSLPSIEEIEKELEGGDE
ncbi:MAG: PDDEXK nuclease domain-containing protein [Thermodesulfobacteriota bacterium]